MTLQLAIFSDARELSVFINDNSITKDNPINSPNTPPMINILIAKLIIRSNISIVITSL